MIGGGEGRRRIARHLRMAYATGLLSDETFVSRLEDLLQRPLVEPARLIGDLNLRRRPRSAAAAIVQRMTLLLKPELAEQPSPAIMLGLDWTGSDSEVLIGRHPACDVVLDDDDVSRRHAQLRFRDGSWVLRDLDSTNGTSVNGTPVGRCELHPGDVLAISGRRLLID